MLLHLKKRINLTLQQTVLDLTARFPAHASLSPSNNPLGSSVPDSGPGRGRGRNPRPRPLFVHLPWWHVGKTLESSHVEPEKHGGSFVVHTWCSFSPSVTLTWVWFWGEVPLVFRQVCTIVYLPPSSTHFTTRFNNKPNGCLHEERIMSITCRMPHQPDSHKRFEALKWKYITQ